jgi:tetratricopeptide (TPR) repeat protein
VASDLVPATFSLPKIPLKPEEILARFLHAHAMQWDHLAGAMRRMSAPVEHHRHAASAYLRLVVIDVAVRVGALLWLLQGPDGRLPKPTWADDRGAGLLLRAMLERCGERRPTRDEIAGELGTNFKTVDGWLDGQSRPDDGNILRLAKLLSARGAGEEAALAREIRLVFSLEALSHLVADVVGRRWMVEMMVRVVLYANAIPPFLRHSTLPRETLDETMQINLVAGTFPKAPAWVPNMLKHIWRNETDPVWRTDLMVVTESWLRRLQDVAMRLEPIDEARMMRELGEVPSADALDVMLYMIQANRDEHMANPLYEAATEELMATDPVFASREFKIASAQANSAGDRLKAIELAREAVRLGPTDAENHFRLGALLWQLGDFAEGLFECEIAAQLAPKWDRARVEVALALLNQGRDREALQRLEVAKAELPEPTPWLLFILAFLRERAGDIQGAITAYEEQLALDANDGEALDRLAHLYFTVGDTKAAIERSKRANHLGFPTVFRAWEADYYKGRGPKPRPPQVLPVELVRIPDQFWFERKR